MMHRLLLAAVLGVLVFFAAAGRESASGVGLIPFNFVRGTVTGSGFAVTSPTALAWGPDGRLYVGDSSGRIQALTLDANKQVTAVQQIASSSSMLETFGMAFDPADGSLYVTNTISGFGDEGAAPAGSFPGMITRFSGPGYGTRTDVITGLPVANSGHESNGLAFGPDGRLYIAEGSTTNAGINTPGAGLFEREEVPTSAAILVADVHAPGFNGNITYSPPNTYDETVVQTGGDVSVYAPGFRNPYDILFHSNGRMYNTDNGPNAGYGPASTSCTTEGPNNVGGPDELNIVVAGGYYGHPNRSRGDTDPRQCVFHLSTEPSTADYTAPIATIPSSSNGFVEYTSSAFGSGMQGNLIYAGWNLSDLHRVRLSADGLSVVEDVVLATGLQNALDVAMSPDGTLYVAEQGGNKLTFFKPDETPVSTISVNSITPAGGPLSGGQPVTITGTNFTISSDTTGSIGGAPLTNIKVQNSTTLTAVTTANSAGVKDVTITNSINTATKVGAYNYSAGGGVIPPVANAGDDVSTPIAHEDHAHVTLDGRNSTDADGFITSYVWTEGSTVLSTLSADSVRFTLGDHLVTLTVTDNDGFVDTDEVRVIVTATAENPDPYYCFDVDGDTDVDAADLNLVASSFNTRQFGNGYSRLRDWNADRVINSADVMGTAADFTGACALVDQQIRAATAGTEQYQNINNAYAAGYQQITPYIAGMGRHMLVGGVASTLNQDTNFDPGAPESLLYEPDASSPGGWRLGGVMYIIPEPLHPLPPDGFATNTDPWHYHDNLCIWNNGNSVAENVAQSTCQSVGGTWFARAGWLLHLWNYHLNPTGRFVEINNTLTQGPVSTSATIAIDADPGTAGVQTSRSVSGSTYTVDVVASNINSIGAFNFDVVYNGTAFSAPTISTGASTDRNPDANQSFLESTGRAFSCTPPAPAGDVASGLNKAARISCTSTGPGVGANAGSAQKIASVTFNVIMGGTNSPISLANVNVFNDTGEVELASCAPVVSATATCANATITAPASPDSDGDGCRDGAELGSDPLHGGDRSMSNFWDAFDVPVPAIGSSPGPWPKNRVIGLTDAAAVLYYVGTTDGGAANLNGVDYDSDLNANTFDDGLEYDRTVSSDPSKLWRSGPPNGVISLQDVGVVLAQVGTNCTP
jgi:glucose/arabinose dehydrogenase